MLFSRTSTTKEIFGSDPEVFHAGKGNAVLGPIMGEHSLLLVDGAKHKRARKLLMPAFRPSAMEGYRTVVAQLAREEVATWTPGRGAAQPRADERADPGGHPARRLRRGRRGAARPAPPAGQRHRRREAGRAARLGLPGRCSASARGRRSCRSSASSTGCSTPRSPSAVRPPTWPSGPTCSPSCCCRPREGEGRGAAQRRGAARPAGDAAAGRSRDDRLGPRLGALRARTAPGADATCPAGGARRRRRPTSRR